MTEDQALEQTTSEWPRRPWLLAGLLGLAGLLIGAITGGYDDDPVKMAAAAFLFFGSLSAAVSIERDKWKEAAIFALVAGLVMAGLAWQVIGGEGRYAGKEFGFAAGVVATVIALPLFQAGFHRTRFATPYRTIHFHAWTDAVSGAGSLAFVGLTWLMTALLANLFHLLQIDLLHDLIDQAWFGWMLSGVAFGAALGVLRNKLSIIGMLQSVAMLVLSLLAVPLAVALVLFLLAMLVSGPAVLWEATRSATPILLGCAAGAWVLTNAIVRDDDAEVSGNPVMRITSLVLALLVLPLTLFAAISMGTRIAAHGLSPERLWALVAIAAACSFGVAYVVAVARGRLAGWRALLRRANMNLAAGLSVIALFLALPILDFGAISVSNQMGRLERGAVAPEEFDFDALKWDFGASGEQALAQLAASDNATIAKLAKAAEKRWTRPYDHFGPRRRGINRTERLAKLHFQFEDAVLRKQFGDYVIDRGDCHHTCVAAQIGTYPDGSPHLVLIEWREVDHLHLAADGRIARGSPPPPPLCDEARPETCPPPMPAEPHTPTPQPSDSPDWKPKIELKPYSGRQIYLDGKPVGEPFE